MNEISRQMLQFCFKPPCMVSSEIVSYLQGMVNTQVKKHRQSGRGYMTEILLNQS